MGGYGLEVYCHRVVSTNIIIISTSGYLRAENTVTSTWRDTHAKEMDFDKTKQAAAVGTRWLKAKKIKRISLEYKIYSSWDRGYMIMINYVDVYQQQFSFDVSYMFQSWTRYKTEFIVEAFVD